MYVFISYRCSLVDKLQISCSSINEGEADYVFIFNFISIGILMEIMTNKIIDMIDT